MLIAYIHHFYLHVFLKNYYADISFAMRTERNTICKRHLIALSYLLTRITTIQNSAGPSRGKICYEYGGDPAYGTSFSRLSWAQLIVY